MNCLELERKDFGLNGHIKTSYLRYMAFQDLVYRVRPDGGIVILKDQWNVCGGRTLFFAE